MEAIEGLDEHGSSPSTETDQAAHYENEDLVTNKMVEEPIEQGQLRVEPLRLDDPLTAVTEELPSVCSIQQSISDNQNRNQQLGRFGPPFTFPKCKLRLLKADSCCTPLTLLKALKTSTEFYSSSTVGHRRNPSLNPLAETFNFDPFIETRSFVPHRASQQVEREFKLIPGRSDSPIGIRITPSPIPVKDDQLFRDQVPVNTHLSLEPRPSRDDMAAGFQRVSGDARRYPSSNLTRSENRPPMSNVLCRNGPQCRKFQEGRSKVCNISGSWAYGL